MAQLKPKPAHLKPKAEIERDIIQYRTGLGKQRLLSQVIGKEETKSIWFSFEQMQELWEEIIFQTVNNKKNVSGTRVYLTSYQNGSRFEKQMGLVFVLTENIGTEASPKHKDFFIEEQSGFENRPNPTGADGKSIKILGLDHGTPCPPDCDGEQDPEWP